MGNQVSARASRLLLLCTGCSAWCGPGSPRGPVDSYTGTQCLVGLSLRFVLWLQRVCFTHARFNVQGSRQQHCMPRDFLRSGRQRERGGGRETEAEAESVTSLTLGASATHEVWTRPSWCRVDGFPTSVMKTPERSWFVDDHSFAGSGPASLAA